MEDSSPSPIPEQSHDIPSAVDHVQRAKTYMGSVIRNVLLVIFGVVIGVGGYASYVVLKPKPPVTSFEECVKANGSQTTLMYPGTCTTKDGTQFIQQTIVPTMPDDTSTVPSAWNTETSGTLGVSFRVPPELSLLDLSGRETPGEVGTQYCMIYTGDLSFSIIPRIYAGSGPCGGGTLTIGSVSRDYVAGREGGFGDFTGYEKRGGSYYPRFINTISSTALPSVLVREHTNANGVTYLRISGKTSSQNYGGEQMMIPVYGTPGDGFAGALINISHDRYAGFSISMKVRSSDDEQTFDTILSTLSFAKTVNQNTCPKTEWVDCMPGPDTGVKWECTSEFLSWAKANCPNFKGAAR